MNDEQKKASSCLSFIVHRSSFIVRCFGGGGPSRGRRAGQEQGEAAAEGADGQGRRQGEETQSLFRKPISRSDRRLACRFVRTGDDRRAACRYEDAAAQVLAQTSTPMSCQELIE